MKLIYFVTLGILSFVTCLQAQTANNNPTTQMSASVMADYVNHFGVGPQFGEPTGINAKYWINDCLALDGAAGWSPEDSPAAEIHVDLLCHNFDLIRPPSGQMPVYIGAGMLGRFRRDNRSNLAGFRFPIGVSYMFQNCPVDVFAEVAPEIIFAPFGRGGITGAIGFRIWF